MLAKTIVISSFLCALFLRCLAQSPPPDSIVYSSAAVQVINYFKVNIASQSELYNGTGYVLYPPGNKGTFYFQDKNYCIPALICYNRRWYKDIPVLYDVRNDAMVSVENNNLFVLQTDRLSDIYLLDHHFIYLDAKSAVNLDAGFYDMLYDGKSQVLVKRTKLINQTNPAAMIYEDKITIYLKKGNKYMLVSSEGTLMDAFAERKQELRQYIKTNKIRFNKDKEHSVAQLAAYYDQIHN